MPQETKVEYIEEEFENVEEEFEYIENAEESVQKKELFIQGNVIQILMKNIYVINQGKNPVDIKTWEEYLEEIKTDPNWELKETADLFKELKEKVVDLIMVHTSNILDK